jgi:hypothetical protein
VSLQKIMERAAESGLTPDRQRCGCKWEGKLMVCKTHSKQVKRFLERKERRVK